MMLLLALYPTISLQVTHIRGVGFFYEFSKCNTIPSVESEIDLRADIFGAREESDALQDERIKN